MNAPASAVYDPSLDRLPSGQACLTCRKRKLKCDGSRPCCDFCTKRSLQCVYDKTTKHPGISREYVETLEDKVRRLEQELRRRSDGPSTVALARPTHSSEYNDATLVQGFQKRHPQSRVRSAPPENVQSISPDADSTSLEKDHDFVKVIRYGEISIHSAMADFGLAPSGTSPTDALHLLDANVPDMESSEREPEICSGDSLGLDDNSYVLPTRPLACRLVDLFFENTHPLLPLVHEPTFRKTFSDVYDHHKPGSIAFRSLINVIFAYGCDDLDLDLTQTYELAQDFHERATDLILLVCYDLASLEVVQALLLVTLHLYSSMQFHRMWINTGLLVRMAQALNLHLDPSSWNISMIEKELRKRLWWSIYSLDRFISLKLCRPPALTLEKGHSVPPTAVDDEYISPTCIEMPQGSNSRPSLMHFFNSLLPLIYISETVLSPNSQQPQRLLTRQDTEATCKEDPRVHLYKLITLAAEQESKLTSWLWGLPDHLRSDAVNSDRKLLKQQRGLHIRYLHARLMTHRPSAVFAINLDREKGNLDFKDTFLQSILIASIRQCIDCSCELISHVKEYYAKGVLGPWWLLVQYLFTTLATLSAISVRRNLMQDLDEKMIQLSITTAMDLLRSFGDINPTLTQCRAYFESLKYCAPGRTPNLYPEASGGLSRIPTRQQSATGQFAEAIFPPQPLQQYYGQSISDFHVNSLHFPNMDQTMADYNADVFTNTTFGGFNFGTYG